jgi:hypothetical protein
MGIIKKPTIATYWSTLCSQATSWFWKVFTKHCFAHLLYFFHLVNNEGLPGPGEPDYDPCARYQPPVNHADSVFRYHYSHHQKISVNKSLVGTKNKTSLMQYFPNKHTTAGESNFGHYAILCPTAAWGFSHTEGPGRRKIRATFKKMAWGISS